MVQAIDFQRMGFNDFIQWVPDDGKTYELHQGVVVEMQPTGPHELVGAFIIEELTLAIRQRQLTYTIPKSCLLKPRLPDSGYRPDVAVLDKAELVNEPLWKSASTVQFGKSIPLVVEVVSTNWRDDYAHKLVEYEAMGIAEYWLVDFRALGAVRYIGQPKQPTITICRLIDGEYQLERLVAGQQLRSSIFPELELMTDDIFQSTEL
ncbi:Uma2 family endonuclease [Leptothoe spongobia]|uniref:Uma2 family endonuclease n=1 Tax=Leptothoe spongobia TAU-MAC 1115 TaxID=1967444 RepID=A0A947GK83_9CYAN|nr:Uma2 family endonuclease [Leptothoe spongobia]MBT9316528.1 Uma2 family endonuclease [Leptothoe spongobia TAU-MAC 1115]